MYGLYVCARIQGEMRWNTQRHMGYTVVSEIFAGRNFREFHEEGRIRENYRGYV